MQTTRLGRRWLTTKLIFIAVLLGFGAWGLLDATVLYKARGLNDASYKLSVYLDSARSAGKLSPGGVRVENPAATLAELRTRKSDLASASKGDTSAGRNSAMELAKYEWLESLASVWKLKPTPQPLGTAATTQASGTSTTANTKDPARQLFFDPVKGEGFSTTGKADDPRVTVELGGLLDELTRKWNTQAKSKPLASYDLAVQWIFVALGFGGGLYLLIVVLRAAGTKYRWDAAPKRLQLPGGRAIVPADLKDVDKRKWHKYYATLNLHDGSNIELDLYTHDPLEAWVLEMERTAFPERALAEEQAKAKAIAAGSDGGVVHASDTEKSSQDRSEIGHHGHDAGGSGSSGGDSGGGGGGGGDGGGD